jgi:hypothetical protein
MQNDILLSCTRALPFLFNKLLFIKKMILSYQNLFQVGVVVVAYGKTHTLYPPTPLINVLEN